MGKMKDLENKQRVKRGKARSSPRRRLSKRSTGASSGCASPESRERYKYFLAAGTRWLDNDAYGHVNNVVHYSYFDTVVNRYLIEAGALDITGSGAIGLVVETHCEYFSPIAFPDNVHIGLRVATLGRTSVRYEIGIFRNDNLRASAQGHFVHVYVDRVNRRPRPLSRALREALRPLLAEQGR